MPSPKDTVVASLLRVLGGSRLGRAASEGIGQMVENLLGGRMPRATREQINAVEALLDEAGVSVRTPPRALVRPSPIERPTRAPEAEPDILVKPLGSRAVNAEPPLPDDEPDFGEEVRNFKSSNVYSFSYNARTQTLYVTYLAHAIHPGSTTQGKGRKGGRTQLHGKLGRTVGGKTNERGPMYAYLKVPMGVYQNMRAAASKGRFVWDALRIEGSIYGHQYAYTLVQGQVTPSVGNTYIPRKATSEGFRVRSVADLGTGRRDFQSSTLPQSTFRSRTI